MFQKALLIYGNLVEFVQVDKEKSSQGTLRFLFAAEVQAVGVTRNFAASLFRNIKYFTLRKLYLCRKWMQKRLQKTTTTGITLPNFDFLAWAVLK